MREDENKMAQNEEKMKETWDQEWENAKKFLKNLKM